MKRIYSILLAGVALVAIASCGNRGKKAEAVEFEDTVETEEASVVKVYSYAYDGYTNVRQSPTSKSAVLGKLRHGNEYVVGLDVVDNWIEVEYYGQIGYVHKDHVADTPSKPVTVDVDANWLTGCWSDYGYVYYLIYSNGKYTEEHQYGTMLHGKWHLEGNEIVLTSVYVTEYGKSFDLSSGNVERFDINKSARTIGGMKKWNMPAELEEGEDGITKGLFNVLKKEANKYVKLTNTKGSRVIYKLQTMESEQMDSVDDSSEEVEERPKKKGKSEDWDAVLTSYEEYVDKYISFAKKAAQGDMRALAKYPSLMQKAEDLSEKLEDAEDDMSAAQLARYTKISMKLMKAAEELDE